MRREGTVLAAIRVAAVVHISAVAAVRILVAAVLRTSAVAALRILLPILAAVASRTLHRTSAPAHILRRISTSVGAAG
jgi:hypothetical protein